MAIKKAISFEVLTDKRCRKCNEIKKIDLFAQSKTTYRYDSWCKPCHSFAANGVAGNPIGKKRTSTFDNALCHVFLGVKTTSFTKQSVYKV